MPLPYATTGPHIHSRDSVPRTMWQIVVGLLPAVVAACLFFGLRSLHAVFGTALLCVLFERPFAPGRYSRRRPLGDGSAFVAGLILGLSLSPTTRWWIPPAGAFVLVTLGKQLFGGLGHNLFNPALVARGVLLLCWPRHLTGWVTPFDGLTSATPLAGAEAGTLALFLGAVPGSLGETSVPAILLGAAWLLHRGLIRWQVPAAVAVGALAAALLFGVDPLRTLLAGSLLFGAVFMATDMVTSPTGKTAHLMFGFGCGFLTVVIRTFTALPEGVTYAFLLMNGLAYLFDRLGSDPIFGQVRERTRRLANAAIASGAIAIVALATGLSAAGRSAADARLADAALRRAVRREYPSATRIVRAASHDDAVTRYRVYDGRRMLGWLAVATAGGYGGPMRLHVVLDPDETLRAVRVAEHSESPTLGAGVASPEFLDAFAGLRPDRRDRVHEATDGLTGATISARAVIQAVERALGAGDPATARAQAAARTPLPALADGRYQGSGRGYNGVITLTLAVDGGRVSGIEVAAHRETPGIGTRALEALSAALIAAQSRDIDGITGATGTSRGFLEAVDNALNAP